MREFQRFSPFFTSLFKISEQGTVNLKLPVSIPPKSSLELEKMKLKNSQRKSQKTAIKPKSSAVAHHPIGKDRQTGSRVPFPNSYLSNFRVLMKLLSPRNRRWKSDHRCKFPRLLATTIHLSHSSRITNVDQYNRRKNNVQTAASKYLGNSQTLHPNPVRKTLRLKNPSPTPGEVQVKMHSENWDKRRSRDVWSKRASFISHDNPPERFILRSARLFSFFLHILRLHH